MEILKKIFARKKIWLAVAMAFVALVFFGVHSLNAKSYVYVDDGASGTMDGSSEHPYDSIQDAIDEAEKEDKNVYVRKGTYKENISIWKDVEVNGSDRDDVVIKAKNGKRTVVKMYHDTAIRKVTIKGGDEGIKVREGAKATIKDCVVRDNDEDGIKVEKAKTSSEKKLVIWDCKIYNNGRSGIFVDTRKVSIKNNEIYDNDTDGIDLNEKSEGEVRNNQVKWNKGTGIKLEIDDAELEVKKNTLRSNKREGIEIETRGRNGYVLIENNKLYRNERWGIARLERGPFRDDQWQSSLKIIANNLFWENGDGEVSPIIPMY